MSNIIKYVFTTYNLRDTTNALTKNYWGAINKIGLLGFISLRNKDYSNATKLSKRCLVMVSGNFQYLVSIFPCSNIPLLSLPFSLSPASLSLFTSSLSPFSLSPPFSLSTSPPLYLSRSLSLSFSLDIYSAIYSRALC